MTTTASGLLGVSPDGRFRIHFDRTLDHSTDRVWSALVDPERLGVWMEGCRIDARVGGAAYFDFGEEGAATGTVTEVVPPLGTGVGVLVHTWEWDDLPVSEVTWTVAPVERGTRLQLTHSELIEGGVTDFAMGWDVIVATMTRHLDGLPLEGVWDNAERIAVEYVDQLAGLRDGDGSPARL